MASSANTGSTDLCRLWSPLGDIFDLISDLGPVYLSDLMLQIIDLCARPCLMKLECECPPSSMLVTRFRFKHDAELITINISALDIAPLAALVDPLRHVRGSSNNQVVSGRWKTMQKSLLNWGSKVQKRWNDLGYLCKLFLSSLSLQPFTAHPHSATALYA